MFCAKLLKIYIFFSIEIFNFKAEKILCISESHEQVFVMVVSNLTDIGMNLV